jgi:hypothetical protein
VPEIEIALITTLGFTTNPSTTGVVLNLFPAAFGGTFEWHEQSMHTINGKLSETARFLIIVDNF